MRIYWPDPNGETTCKLKCSYIDCAYGMGLAGAGRCPGAWWMTNCPEHETISELEERWNNDPQSIHRNECAFNRMARELSNDPKKKNKTS